VEGMTEQLLISNLHGKVLKEVSFTHPVSSGTVPLPRLASGMYILTFERLGEQTTRQLLTIQK
jgi:hypothetical protein